MVWILKNKGITLVALVVTIVILLILAGITISGLGGENGLITRVKQAKQNAIEAQELENLILADYERVINEKDVGSNKEVESDKEDESNKENNIIQDSTLISNVEMEVTKLTYTGFTINVTAQTENQSNILDYHVYIENTKTLEQKAVAQNTGNVEVNGLESSTTYKISVMACDINKKFKMSKEYEVTTLDAPLITIDNAYNVYVRGIHGSTNPSAQEVSEVLFDGNYDNGGEYKGVLLNPAYPSYLEITVTKNIKIYAYGHTFSDGVGASGKDVIFSKYNGSSYEEYKTCATNASGTKYELVILEPGKYKVTPSARYVNFDEWEVEVTE